MIENHRRSIIKAVTWRIIALTVTSVVVFLFTQETVLAVEIGLIDSLIKLFTYYAHERAWNKIRFGREKIEYHI